MVVGAAACTLSGYGGDACMLWPIGVGGVVVSSSDQA